MTTPHPSASGAHHRYTVDFSRHDGDPLGSLGIELDPQAALGSGVDTGGGIGGIDWEPAREWLRHLALRSELPAPASGWLDAPLVVEPVFEAPAGPTCSAIRVSLSSGAHTVSCELEPEYFRPVAEQLALSLVSDGKLAANDHFLFQLCAFPQANAPRSSLHAPAATAGCFRVEADPTEPAIVEQPIAPLLAAAQPRGPHSDDDVPVFVQASVLAEMSELAREAGELESGGVLAGHLRRCPDRRQLYVEVTAAIPARHGEAGSGSFAFTPDTWAAADRAIELRAAGEVPVGWSHSHPHFCRRCPDARRRSCLLAEPFFSNEDEHLHRTVFPVAHQVGLLISNLGDRGLVPTLYGWRNALVTERGFHELA